MLSLIVLEIAKISVSVPSIPEACPWIRIKKNKFLYHGRGTKAEAIEAKEKAKEICTITGVINKLIYSSSLCRINKCKSETIQKGTGKKKLISSLE